MLSDQDPTARKSREEYRRDLPLGLGTSTIVHVIAVFVLLSGATIYAVTQTPPAKDQVKSQIITIETLVRTPQSVAQPKRIVQTQRPVPVEVSRPTLTTLTTRSASASTLSPTSHVAAAPARVSPAERSGFYVLPRIKPAKAVKVYTAGTGVATAPTVPVLNAQGSVAASGANDSYEPSHGHNGAVMSERAPSGPLGGGGGDSSFGGITIGHGHDDCTPSRGGFFR
jgi:hypothetical protein